MTDRELLEKAAKAAGIALKPMEMKNVSFQGDDRFIGFMTEIEQWPRGWFNPLTDDGDALRLAVKLRMQIRVDDYGCGARIGDGPWSMCEAHLYGGIEPATRRAITRAAAALAP